MDKNIRHRESNLIENITGKKSIENIHYIDESGSQKTAKTKLYKAAISKINYELQKMEEIQKGLGNKEKRRETEENRTKGKNEQKKT